MEEFDVAVRGGCSSPEVNETVWAENILKANQIVDDKYGQCYVAIPRKKVEEKGGV